MTVGTPWGDTYNDPMEARLAHHGLMGNKEDVPITGESKHIDREHDVPLLAAALDDGKGFYGIAIDRRIPHYATIDGVTFDPGQFVHEHEKVEHGHMEETGTPYQESHDKVATPHERTLVSAFAAENNKDPESFWKQYQQFWSSHLPKTQQAEKVHPDTYLKPYEDSGHELLEKMKSGKQYAMELKAANDNRLAGGPGGPEMTGGGGASRGGQPVGEIKNLFGYRGSKTPANENMSTKDPNMIDQPGLDEFMDQQWKALQRSQTPGTYEHAVAEQGRKPKLKSIEGGKKEEPETVVSPASRYAKKKHGGEPEVITGHNHWEDIVHKATKKGFNPYEDLVDDGFVTSKGRFVSRKEAYDMQVKTKGKENLADLAHRQGRLISEDLDLGARWNKDILEKTNPDILKPGKRRVPWGHSPEEIDEMSVDEYIKLMNFVAEPLP